MKQIILIAALMSLTNFFTKAQTPTKDGVSTNHKSFDDVRKEDFKKLLGTEANFEGFTVKYDKDKTSLLGNGGFFTYKSKHVLFINGSIGTSTDITNIFNQEVLPTFSLGVSYNILIKQPYTKYYYDGELDTYRTGIAQRKQAIETAKLHQQFQLQYAPGINAKSVTQADSEAKAYIKQIKTGDHRFQYRKKMVERIAKGLEDRPYVYTFKRLIWLSMGAKYNNDQYGFIDYTRPFKSQQFDTSYSTFSGLVSLNGYFGWNQDEYKWNSLQPLKYRPVYIFGSVFGRVSKNNNIGEIKKTTVYDLAHSDYDTTSKILRQSGKSQSYYNGNYYEFLATTFGARLLISPFNHIAFDFAAEMNFISRSDKNTYNLNDYSTLKAGFFIYTGSKETFKINIGVAVKRQQSVTNNTWQNKLELVTSIPIGSAI